MNLNHQISLLRTFPKLTKELTVILQKTKELFSKEPSNTKKNDKNT